MAARLRAFDWSRSPLGPVESWPQSLLTAVSIMLNSKYPMFLAWGDELTFLYNDGYQPILGNKHPAALGQRFARIWAEIWGDIEPLVARALGGEATWSENLQLFTERSGFVEETYFTFSYSPVRDESGGVGGMFCACTETTQGVIGERQLALLRDLAAASGSSRDQLEACRCSAEALGSNLRDFPFAAIYLPRPDDSGLILGGVSGIASGHSLAPDEVVFGDSSYLPLETAFRERRAPMLEVPLGAEASVPTGAWNVPPTRVALVPLAPPGQSNRGGLLAVGLNPFRRLDERYRSFVGLVGGQIAASITSARAFDEEKRRAEALAELDRAKTAFFSNVSHEFRTPLTLMLGPLEELLSGSKKELASAIEAQLEVVHRNGLRLLRLVNTLLDFSRIEAGRERATYEPTDLGAFSSELASNFRSPCERAGLRLVVDCPSLPEPVFVDRDMWEKIVLNLLSNAFKFTFEGEIAVTLRRVGSDAELRVRDTGAGIPEAELSRVFERFHRIENVHARTHEGTGIGLALVQELVKLHGGSVGVSSVLGKGTTFVVTVPLGSAHLPARQIGSHRSHASTAAAASPFIEEALRWLPDDAGNRGPGSAELPGRYEPIPTADPESSAGASDDRPRVLVADDNADMRQYLCRLLADRYRVEAVPDGERALAAARRQPPDLVLTDVMMPRLDGAGLLRGLRSDPRTSGLPIILLSARAGEESRVDGIAAGADDYLFKPFSGRELLARVESQLELGRVRRQASEAMRLRSEQLREADRRKDEFLATLAHELRNPLAAIRNAVQVLVRSDGDAPTVGRAVGILDRQLGHMSRQVDDLLDVSRISLGKIELRKERVELVEVVHHAVEAARTLCERLGHELTVTPPATPLHVYGDPVRLAQVVGNLLSNACKFTDERGRIWLTIDQEGEQAVVRVRDSGIGIAAHQLGTIFEMFAQADRSLERSRDGLGVGLTLVRSLAELHGGTVEVHSAGVGRGSEFVVRLPLLAAPPLPSSEPRDADELVTTVARRILVVDDNRDSADSLAMLLRLMGNEVDTAHDGLEAVERVAMFGADVVLLDIGMPRLNGYEAARRIREQSSRSVTLVALTGWGQDEDRRRSEQAGFDAHLVKPVDLDALAALLAGAHAAPRKA